MVQYTSVRPNIKSGDLLAWSHHGWDSWHNLKVQAVRMATRSEYSHVAMAWITGGRVMVLEAVMPRVRIFPLSLLLPCHWYPLGLEWTKETEDAALECVGEPYSQKQAIAAFFGHLVLGGDRAWQCAEYVIQRNGAGFQCQAVPAAIVLTAQERGSPGYYITKQGGLPCPD